MSENPDGLPPLSSDAATLTEGLIKGAEVLATVAETATAYRNGLISAGWSVPVAEQLAGAVLATLQHEDAAPFIDLLDRLDEKDGVVRVNLAKQRAIDADLSRVRAALHAALQAFENGITPPDSMIEGWRLAEAGR